ncbi:hypothetical protein BC831DRAFT_170708 [Entophlyctis helioformis]|nr:hypothetical protein BC831DRAFT_170708 [Entophlyctis helioformis]
MLCCCTWGRFWWMPTTVDIAAWTTCLPACVAIDDLQYSLNQSALDAFRREDNVVTDTCQMPPSDDLDGDKGERVCKRACERAVMMSIAVA